VLRPPEPARVVPFTACISSLVVGITSLVLGGAPDQMIALALAMFATLVVSLGWKISMHAAVAAGSVVVLTSPTGLAPARRRCALLAAAALPGAGRSPLTAGNDRRPLA
jgi:hypothetical protein